GEDVREVPGTLAIAFVVVDTAPGVARVVGAEDAALFRFDQRVNAVGIAARNRHAAASPNTAGKAVTFKPLPRGAAVDGFIDPAARAAAVERIRRADNLPNRGKQGIWIFRIEDD